MAFIKSGKEFDKMGHEKKMRRRLMKYAKVTFNVPDPTMRLFKKKLVEKRKNQTEALNDMILKYIEIP